MSQLCCSNDPVPCGTYGYTGDRREGSRASGNVHIIYEVDPGKLLPEGEPLVPVYEPAPSSNAPTGILEEDGSNIDVMILYTDDARVEAV